MNKGEGSLFIHDFQWDKFWLTIDKYEGLDPHDAKFVMDWMQDNDSNELWLRTFRDCLSGRFRKIQNN
jgi:hypothetical protein